MSGVKNIHDGHRERMRQRFDKTGFNGWQNHEILEYMLFHVFPRGDQNELAHKILNASGNSMKRVFMNAENGSLSEVLGVGDSTVRFLRVLKEFTDCYINNIISEKSITITKDSFYEVVRMLGFREDREDIIMLCMDNYSRLKLVASVTENSSECMASTSIQRVCRIATSADAASVLFVHNHPSGNTKPSYADYINTSYLNDALNAIDVKMIDHYIVCDNEIISIRMTALQNPAEKIKSDRILNEYK